MPRVPIITVVLCGCLGQVLRADPPGKDAPAAALKPVFSEDFKTVPLGRFKQLGPGEVNLALDRGAATLHPGVRWVRPAPAGHTAELVLKLEMLPVAKDADAASAHFGFVLSNRQIGKIALVRERKDGLVKSAVELIQMMPDPQGQGPDRIDHLRRIAQEGDLPSGAWSIHYRHGLVIVQHDGKEVARGYFETPGAAVLGVTWDQVQGKLTCLGMEVRGLGMPQQTAEQRGQLQLASRINHEALKLAAEGKANEALTHVRQASELFLKVLGEEHHDSANSLANSAMILEQLGKIDEAQGLYERALKTRRKVLGEDHPSTALVQFHLGILLLRRGTPLDARAHFTRCLAVYRQALGDDHRLTKSLAAIMAKLPQAQ